MDTLHPGLGRVQVMAPALLFSDGSFYGLPSRSLGMIGTLLLVMLSGKILCCSPVSHYGGSFLARGDSAIGVVGAPTISVPCKLGACAATKRGSNATQLISRVPITCSR